MIYHIWLYIYTYILDHHLLAFSPCGCIFQHMDTILKPNVIYYRNGSWKSLKEAHEHCRDTDFETSSQVCQGIGSKYHRIKFEKILQMIQCTCIKMFVISYLFFSWKSHRKKPSNHQNWDLRVSKVQVFLVIKRLKPTKTQPFSPSTIPDLPNLRVQALPSRGAEVQDTCGNVRKNNFAKMIVYINSNIFLEKQWLFVVSSSIKTT